jgi:rhodanese-related sulfurtransferase
MEHLHPTQVHEILQASPDTPPIDCRTEAEANFVGHPIGAINVEWTAAPDFEVNPHSGEEVLHMVGRKDRPIIPICRSGKRPVDAGPRPDRFSGHDRAPL